MASLYKKSGVDIDKGDRFVEAIKPLVQMTQNSRVISGVGGFASLYQINSQQVLAASTDGVGTKVKVAQQLKRHQGIGQDLVAMCANDLICTGAKPLFFLDYLASGKLDLKTNQLLIKSIAKACLDSGMALIGGETAEMPGVYADGVYDLAGFAVGLVDKSKIIDGKKLKNGDIIVGLASSGLHSNGFSLVRKIFNSSEKQWLNKALTPTRLYVHSITNLLSKNNHGIKGIAHITGSGFLNIPRINENFDFYIDSLPANLPIYKEILNRTKMSNKECYTTFNMGIGMVLVVSPKHVKKLIKQFNALGEKAYPLGLVKKGQGRVFLYQEELT